MNIEHRTSNIERRTGRRVLRMAGLLVAGIFLGAMNSGAQTNTNTNASTDNGPSFESFRIITRNNIFDPNRSPRFIRPDPGLRVRPRAVDAFALVGTMSYEKGKFAFFDSPNPQYKKVLEPGANIAGYTVKDVDTKAVTLAANGKEFQMKVGTQLRNEGANGWRMAAYTEAPDASESDSNNADITQPSTPPAGATPEMSDVLKRLMQQRQQELK